eukprot:364590-Chlamydomonas_euryale.AAC.6
MPFHVGASVLVSRQPKKLDPPTSGWIVKIVWPLPGQKLNDMGHTEHAPPHVKRVLRTSCSYSHVLYMIQTPQLGSHPLKTLRKPAKEPQRKEPVRSEGSRRHQQGACAWLVMGRERHHVHRQAQVHQRLVARVIAQRRVVPFGNVERSQLEVHALHTREAGLGSMWVRGLSSFRCTRCTHGKLVKRGMWVWGLAAGRRARWAARVSLHTLAARQGVPAVHMRGVANLVTSSVKV